MRQVGHRTAALMFNLSPEDPPCCSLSLQAILSLLRGPEQDTATQLALRCSALSHMKCALQCSAAAGRADLAEAIATDMWNGAGGLLATGLTKACLIDPLMAGVAALNSTKPRNIRFQVEHLYTLIS
jgi:hypothetical protein